LRFTVWGLGCRVVGKRERVGFKVEGVRLRFRV
jgi:hypothetical protein